MMNVPIWHYRSPTKEYVDALKIYKHYKNEK